MRRSPSPDEDDVDDTGDAMLCSAVGRAEVSCDNVACELPAEVPVAWVTARDCPANAPGLVVGAGAVNGVTFDAAADDPA